MGKTIGSIVDYSTKPEGFRDSLATFGETSSPIIVGPSPAGMMGRAFYNGGDGKYYPGVLVQRWGGDGRGPIPPSRKAILEQEVLLSLDGQERSLGNVMVWYPRRPGGLVFLASYLQVDVSGKVFAWIRYYHPPTPGDPQEIREERREFTARADGQVHRMSNIIDAEKVTLTLDGETVVFPIPAETRFTTISIGQFYVGNLFTGFCSRIISETSEVPDRTPAEAAAIEALINAGMAEEAETERKRREKMKADQLAARQAAAAKAREEARKRRESGK